MDLLDDLLLDVEPAEEQCLGTVYRASVSFYLTARGFAQTVKLNKLKKLSCPGCKYCGWENDTLSEVNKDWPILGMDKVEDQKLYTLGMCNVTTDWESGIVDGWDLELVEYVPDDNNGEK